mgnify:CR=1 FL=1|jgi:FKBP-type peptidyl-prolyl cis-trans isomerase SlyD
MALKNKDFIEIEFTARVKDGEIFDSNIKEDLKKLNPEATSKPFIFPLGQTMFLKGVEDYLIGKEIGKHKIELTPENAFGKRDSKLVQRMPMRVFREHNLNPIPGISFNFDGKMGKVLAASGGRVIVDFNNPIAGKEVIYEVNIKRKIDNQKEQISSFIEFLFKKELKFEVKEKKITISVEKQMTKFVELFADKFKEIFKLDLSVKELEEKSPKKSQ